MQPLIREDNTHGKQRPDTYKRRQYTWQQDDLITLLAGVCFKDSTGDKVECYDIVAQLQAATPKNDVV